MSVNISGFFSALTFAGFFSLGRLFYKLWIPNQDIELLYALTVVTILAYVTEGPVHPLYYIYTLTVKNRVPCIITLLGGVLNVVGMFVLVRYTNHGNLSIVITTTIITTITSMITNPPYIAHCLKLKMVHFLSDAIDQYYWLGYYDSFIRFCGEGNCTFHLGWIDRNSLHFIDFGLWNLLYLCIL